MPERPGCVRHARILLACLVLLAGCGGCDRDSPAPTPSAEPTSGAAASPVMPAHLQSLLAALADSPSPHLRGFARLLLRDLDAGRAPSKQELRTLDRLASRLVPDDAAVAPEEWRRRNARAQGQFQALIAADTGLPLWRNLGQGAVPGRMTAVEVYGSLPQREAWAGAANGGVWRLISPAWWPKTDLAPTLNVGALAVDPDDPDVVYVGTGEGNYFADHYTGYGLFRLDDPGVPASPGTLTLIAATDLDFHDLVFAPRPGPASPKVLWAATTGGLFRFDLASSSWSQVTGSLPAADTTAVLFAPWDPLTVIAGVWSTNEAESGIYLSVDGGTSWSLMGLPSTLTPALRGRVALAACSLPAKRVYALLSTPSGGIGGVLRRDAEGANAGEWVDVTSSGLQPGTDQRFHLALACDAGDPEKAYVGLLSVFRREPDGTWTPVAIDKYHQDLHELVSPAANELWAASDGGVYVSQNQGTSWLPAGTGLETTQYYHYAIDPFAPDGGIGGSQDRGAIQVGPAGATVLMTGDIYFTAIHPKVAATRCFAANQGGLIKLGTMEDPSWPALLAAELGAYGRPLVFDRAAPARLLSAAATVHRAANPLTAAGAVFASVAGSAAPAGFYTALDTSASNPDTIYAGTSDGAVCGNAGGTWACAPLGTGRIVTSVSVHPADPQTAYATLGGAAPGHVWKTTNGGQQWADVSPQDPDGNPIDIHFSHVLALEAAGRVAAAADIGVYVSDDGAQTWSAAGTGLPNSPVSWVAFAPPSALRAATYGRGLWEMTVAGMTPPGTPAVSPTP